MIINEICDTEKSWPALASVRVKDVYAKGILIAVRWFASSRLPTCTIFKQKRSFRTIADKSSLLETIHAHFVGFARVGNIGIAKIGGKKMRFIWKFCGSRLIANPARISVVVRRSVNKTGAAFAGVPNVSVNFQKISKIWLNTENYIIDTIKVLNQRL